MKNILTKSIHYFIDDKTGELNNRGVILAGTLFVLSMIFIGYLEAGGLFPWE